MSEADSLGDKLAKEDLKNHRTKNTGIFDRKPVLSTGNFWIDYVSGSFDGFFPTTAITELAALKGAGKTTIVLETIAYNQLLSDDFSVLYMDWEKNLVRQQDMARDIGADMTSDNFYYRQPNTLEGGCQFIVECLRPHTLKRWLGRDKPLDMIVIDTLAAARAKMEIDNKLGGSKQPGYRGKLWAEFFRNAQADINNDGGPALVVINHLQQQIDMSGKGGYGPPKFDSPGSNALKLYAANRYFLKQLENRSIMMEVTDPFTYEKQKQIRSICCEVFCEKSKLGGPYRKSTYFITPGLGIDEITVMMEAAERKEGVLWNANNAQFGVPKTPGGGKEDCRTKVMGRTNFIDHLREDPTDSRQLASNLNALFEQQIETYWEMRKRIKTLQNSGRVMQEEGHGIQEEETLVPEDTEPEDDL